MFTIDQHSRQPIYEQLKEQIIRYVSLGVLQPQDRMPSVRILARELGINPNTVVKTKAFWSQNLKKVFLSAIRMCIPFYIRGKKKNSARR